ncbi:hypothetical protein [Bosea sp. RAC05]|uniref:hypothetical protein n=1 Tax=Bosea sp. RAC05 TaxID=1842539 RepID=UPI00083DBC2C|nr:hypothetical protein [Bosea sp. RAC05]AOG03253.1 hypothetical protein BSY19_4980 [Bosea sp. RAC05]
MTPGEIYRFNYLWGHEAKKGWTGSRKIRRVCLAMQIGGYLYLFPITSRQPRTEDGDDRLHVEIPEAEKRRINLQLNKPSFLVLDDYNRVRSDRLYDFESLTPTGTLSLDFMAEVARLFQAAIRDKRAIHGLTRP